MGGNVKKAARTPLRIPSARPEPSAVNSPVPTLAQVADVASPIGRRRRVASAVSHALALVDVDLDAPLQLAEGGLDFDSKPRYEIPWRGAPPKPAAPATAPPDPCVTPWSPTPAAERADGDGWPELEAFLHRPRGEPGRTAAPVTDVDDDAFQYALDEEDMRFCAAMVPRPIALACLQRVFTALERDYAHELLHLHSGHSVLGRSLSQGPPEGSRRPSARETSVPPQLGGARRGGRPPPCDVCGTPLDDTGGDDQPITCDGCGIAVHADCIFVEASDIGGTWRCRLCTSGLKAGAVPCFACHRTGGVMLPVVRARQQYCHSKLPGVAPPVLPVACGGTYWAHVICAMLLREASVEMQDPAPPTPTAAAPVSGMATPPRKKMRLEEAVPVVCTPTIHSPPPPPLPVLRFVTFTTAVSRGRCCLCGVETGMKTWCKSRQCGVMLHASCALEHGVVEFKATAGGYHHRAYCKAHVVVRDAAAPPGRTIPVEEELFQVALAAERSVAEGDCPAAVTQYWDRKWFPTLVKQWRERRVARRRSSSEMAQRVLDGNCAPLLAVQRPELVRDHRSDLTLSAVLSLIPELQLFLSRRLEPWLWYQLVATPESIARFDAVSTASFDGGASNDEVAVMLGALQASADCAAQLVAVGEAVAVREALKSRRVALDVEGLLHGIGPRPPPPSAPFSQYLPLDCGREAEELGL